PPTTPHPLSLPDALPICPHHHVLAASRVLAVHLRELVHAGIDDPGPVAVHFLEPSLHRGGDREVDLLDSAAPRADRGAGVDDERSEEHTLNSSHVSISYA